MTRRTTVGLGVLAIALLLVAAALGVQAYLRNSLAQMGIEDLHWADPTLSWRKLELRALSFVQVQPEWRVRVEAEQLAVGWDWQNLRPQVERLTIERLSLNWGGALGPAQTPQTASYTYPTLDIPQSPPFWLPRVISVADLQVTLPCRAGRCELNGSLQASRSGLDSIWPAAAEVRLDADGHEVLVAAEVERYSEEVDPGVPGAQREPPRRLSLSAVLSAGGKEYGQLRTQYLPDDKQESQIRPVHWRGSLEVPALPNAEAVASWFRQWWTIPDFRLPVQPDPDNARLSADWSLQGQAEGDVTRLISGDAVFKGHIPEPWPIPGIATVKGDLELSMALAQEHWQARHVEADLTFTDPAGWIESVPAMLRPQSLVLSIRPGQKSVSSADGSGTKAKGWLALDVSARGRGATRFDIDTVLALPLAAPWTTQINDARIRLDFPEMAAGGWTFRSARADLRGHGEASLEGLILDLSPGANLQLDYVDNPEDEQPFWADGLAADLAETTLSADFKLTEASLDSLRLGGPVTIDAVRLRHDLLKTQPWQFKGDLGLGIDRLTLAGELGAESGVSPNLSLAYDFGDAFSLDAGLELTGAKASQVLAETLSGWPDLLSFSAGAINARVMLGLDSGAPADIEGQLGFAALKGQYDRVDWSGLGGGLAFSLGGNSLYLQTHDLKLDQLNPGVPIENIVLDATYRASSSELEAGVLHLQRATAEILGGSMKVEPNAWPVAERPLLMIMTFAGVGLDKVLELYPTEGVSGTGQLLGRVPVRLGERGISIEGGVTSAAPGGGVLKLPAERFRSLSPDNPAMELVADAVENFHYSVLQSSIDYDQSGKLMLDLHLEGENPEVRDGYPVVLNVSLEEDIPALIQSLQLSGCVNRAVTDQVLDRVEGREGQAR